MGGDSQADSLGTKPAFGKCQPHVKDLGPPRTLRFPRNKADNGKCQKLIQAIVGLEPRFSLFWETDCLMVPHFPTRGDPRFPLAFPKLSSKIGEILGNWIYDIPVGYSLPTISYKPRLNAENGHSYRPGRNSWHGPCIGPRRHPVLTGSCPRGLRTLAA